MFGWCVCISMQIHTWNENFALQNTISGSGELRKSGENKFFTFTCVFLFKSVERCMQIALEVQRLGINRAGFVQYMRSHKNKHFWRAQNLVQLEYKFYILNLINFFQNLITSTHKDYVCNMHIVSVSVLQEQKCLIIFIEIKFVFWWHV